MGSLRGSRTEANLKRAFARECETNRRYLYYAMKADIESCGTAARVFREVAEEETSHALGLLELLENVDPSHDLPIGSTRLNLQAALLSAEKNAETIYPAMASEARQEGFNEIADWFESLSRTAAKYAARYRKAITTSTDDAQRA